MQQQPALQCGPDAKDCLSCRDTDSRGVHTLEIDRAEYQLGQCFLVIQKSLVVWLPCYYACAHTPRHLQRPKARAQPFRVPRLRRHPRMHLPTLGLCMSQPQAQAASSHQSPSTPRPQNRWTRAPSTKMSYGHQPGLPLLQSLTLPRPAAQPSS